MSEWFKHYSLESCANYLPKPHKRYAQVIVQCNWCGNLYRGNRHIAEWIPTTIKAEINE